MERDIKGEIQEELNRQGRLEDAQIRELIVDRVLDATKGLKATLEYKNNLINEIFNSICGYDAIQKLLDDPGVSEVMINGPGSIFYEKKGRIRQEPGCFENEEKLENIIQTMVGKMNRIVNQAKPIADVRLSDGSRVNVVLKPVAVDGPVVTIRKFSSEFLKMEDLLKNDSITQEAIAFLKLIIQSKYNLFISGGTSSGKTTFLNLLSTFIPDSERIITIEDSAELNITNVPNLVRLEIRTGNLEGEGDITIRSLIRTALRMRPDRIIVGEVRGEEAFDMLTAMNTGHDGSLSTGHANSAADMLLRLATMVVVGNNLKEEVAMSLIRSSIDFVVHLSRQYDSRKVMGIYELDKESKELTLRPVFIRREDRRLVQVDEIKYREKMEIYGNEIKDKNKGA